MADPDAHMRPAPSAALPPAVPRSSIRPSAPSALPACSRRTLSILPFPPNFDSLPASRLECLSPPCIGIAASEKPPVAPYTPLRPPLGSASQAPLPVLRLSQKDARLPQTSESPVAAGRLLFPTLPGPLPAVASNIPVALPALLRSDTPSATPRSPNTVSPSPPAGIPPLVCTPRTALPPLSPALPCSTRRLRCGASPSPRCAHPLPPSPGVLSSAAHRSIRIFPPPLP